MSSESLIPARRYIQCRALTIGGDRCKRAAGLEAEPELCATHQRLRVKHGAWPMVPGWAVRERQVPHV